RRTAYLAACAMLGVLCSMEVRAAESPATPSPYPHGDEAALPNGVIGVSLQVGAERIGDPAVLYVGMVHPEGPAHQAGLAHGDEILTVDGTATAGKSYEQVVKMIRGTVGTVVKLGVKGEGGMRELSIARVAGDKLPKGPAGSHGGPSK
ncbi:MAG: PDZ domain-containing protein, partial [Gammaproteobacteria bacterium]|nr:PDZ domain-containing protein [Gammaproteobacteria bacterium]